MLSRALLLFFSGIILIGNGTTQRHPRDKRYNLKVHINATQDTITLKFIKPSPDTKLEGFILGYGSSIFAKQFIALPENGEPYITEVVAEPKYLIAVQPIPPNDMKKHCTGQVNIHKPLQLIIGTVTPTSVLLSWGAMLRSPFQDNIMNECMEDGYFTIRYREKENNRKWTYQDCPTTDTVIDKLRPSTQYEFSVRPCKENNRGVWSSPVTQQTHDTSRSIQQTNNQRTTTNGRMPKGPHDKPQPYASRIILKPGFNKTYTRPISSKVNGRPSPSKPANVPSEMIQESFQTSKSKVAAWPQVAVGNAESKEHGIKKITPSMKIVPFTSSSHQEAGNSTTTSVPPVTLLYIKEDKQMEKSQHKLTYSTTQPPKIYQAHVVDLQGNPPPKPASTTPTTMIHFDKADFIRKSTSPSLVEVPPTIPSILKKKISATVLTSRDGARLWGQGYLKPNNTRQRTKPFWADKGEQYKGISKTKPPPVVAQGLGINLAGEDAVTPERTKQLDSVKNNSLELTPAVKKNSAGDNFPVTESRQQFNTYRSSSTDSTPDFTKPQTEYGPTGSERGDQLISVTNGSNKPEGTVKMQHPGEETTVSHRTISIRNNSVDLKSTIQSHYTAGEVTTTTTTTIQQSFIKNGSTISPATTTQPSSIRNGSPVIPAKTTEPSSVRNSSPVIPEKSTEPSSVRNGSPIIHAKTTEPSSVRNSSPVIPSKATEPSSIRNSSPVTPEKSTEPSSVRNGSPVIPEKKTEPSSVRNGSPVIHAKTTEPSSVRNGSPVIPEKTTEPSSIRNGSSVIPSKTTQPNSIRKSSPVTPAKTTEPSYTKNDSTVIPEKTTEPSCVRNCSPVIPAKTTQHNSIRKSSPVTPAKTTEPSSVKNDSSVFPATTVQSISGRNGSLLNPATTSHPRSVRNDSTVIPATTTEPSSVKYGSVHLDLNITNQLTATEGTTVSEKGSRLNFFTNIQTEADPALTNKYRVNSDKDLDPENQGTSFRNITSEPVTSVAKPGKVSGNHKQPMANRSNSVPPRKQGSSLQNLPSANKLIPNVVEGKPGESGKKMELDIDKSFIFDKISATQKPAKEERKWITTTDAPNINASRMEPIDNSSVFTSFPVTDVDAMGKERFVAPHVKYVHKEDKVPCSITETMRHFPEEDIINQDINSPPKHPPSNLTVVTVEGCPSFVILDWEKVKNDTATEYEVISKEEGSTGKEESVLTTNQTHTAVENLKPNTSYEFRVKPVNILGEGPQSEPVTFSTESADPRVSEYVSGKDAIWTQIPFKADSYSECNGKMFVKRTWYRKFVGIQLCNSLRYKIYLSDTLTGTFYNIGDQSGQGEDHCQFVDSFLDGRTGKQYPPDQLPPRQGFYRSVRQEPVSFGEIGGRTHVSYVQWYECGTTIPGKW
ncbi:target of Nesh-SH3 isoform X2 [Erpetoichthys calabaricus]|uniref:target of Nesh-SH3 isoform X2 n=1 Tax=Erpetoichthys calabaricus TaxID=27687 RepID=UPI0022341539|nr:target of Nesh-SH3 isoform X2 [Erpetoichthys calabaricus]